MLMVKHEFFFIAKLDDSEGNSFFRKYFCFVIVSGCLLSNWIEIFGLKQQKGARFSRSFCVVFISESINSVANLCCESEVTH